MTVQDFDCGVKAKIRTARESWENGKVQSVSYRRCHIAKLYRALREMPEVFCDTIAAESRCSVATAKAGYHLTMDGVWKHHEALKIPSSSKAERRTSHARGSLHRRTPLGVVAIRSLYHSRFYTFIMAISAAFAAGNIVVLEVSVSRAAIKTQNKA